MSCADHIQLGSRRPPSRARGGKGGAVPAGALERSAACVPPVRPGFRALGFFGCAGTDPRPGAYAQSEDNATGPAHAVRTKGAREMTDTTSKRSDAGKRLREYQQVLGSFTRIASESLPLGALLHHAAAQAARVTDIKRAKVMRYRPEKGDLIVAAGVGVEARRCGPRHSRNGPSISTRPVHSDGGGCRD